MPQRYITVF